MDSLVNDQQLIDDTQLLMKIMKGVNAQSFRVFGNKVVSGPFTGMVIPSEWHHWDDGNGSTKLFGSYEHELHESIGMAVWRQPRLVVNVGCAEGYYTIGLARMLPETLVFGLDINEEALDICGEYAHINKVEVELRKGVHSAEEMRFSDLPLRRLYVVDCEGAEPELLDPEKCPELACSDIIVECHDFMRPRTSPYLADRFSMTHRVEWIKPRLPNFERFQFVRECPNILSVLAITEKRPMPTYWLACWANRRN